MEPKLDHLLNALEVRLATHSGIASPGRAFFLVKDPIGGLLGMNLKSGKKVSLPIDDLNVRKMIERGLLEKISDDKAVSA